jgi:hypothetical protein
LSGASGDKPFKQRQPNPSAMLYRLQTALLFLALLCAALNLNFFPFWRYEFFAPSGESLSEPMRLYGLVIFGRSGDVSLVFWAFNVALCLSGALALIAIALFKNRRVQALLAYLGALVSFFTVGMAGLAAFALRTKLGADSSEGAPELGFYLLLAAPVLFFVAARLTARDEATATAYQRL